MTPDSTKAGLREAASSWIVIGLLAVLTIANAVTAVSFANSARNLGGAEAASNAVIRLLSEVKAQGGCDAE